MDRKGRKLIKNGQKKERKKVNKSCEIEQKRKENGQKKRKEMDRNE